MKWGAPPDFRLLSACLQGDRQAWDQFVEKYSGLIHWSIRKVVSGSEFSGRQELAGEIFQSFFERLISRQKLAELRDEKSLVRFLTVSSAYWAMDYLKSLRARERKEFSIEPELLDEEGGPGGVFEIADSNTPAAPEVHQALQDLLNSLKPRERLYLEMCYFEGKGHEEIAYFFGVSKDAVSGVIRRAKDKLRLKLKSKGF